MGELIGAGIVSRNPTPQPMRVEDSQVHIVVHARRPLGAKESPIGGIGPLLEPLCRSLQCRLIHRIPLFHPHVEVGGHSLQRGGYLELLAGVGVAHPEDFLVPKIVGRRCGVDHYRNGRGLGQSVSDPFEPGGQGQGITGWHLNGGQGHGGGNLYLVRHRYGRRGW